MAHTIENNDPANTLESFLSESNSNTKNPLYNIAVVNARLSVAIAKALNMQKSIVESIAEEINQISSLNVEINQYKPNSTDPNGGVKKFGKTAAEALSMLLRMERYGVKDLENYIRDARAGKLSDVTDNQIQLWSTKLNATSETLTSRSQQETLRMQTFTSRYTQASDQATNILQRDLQSKNSITNNIR